MVNVDNAKFLLKIKLQTQVKLNKLNLIRSNQINRIIKK